MAGLKTMHDIRTSRSIATRAMPTSEGEIFLQLHRLASERLRLEREVGVWQRKQQRIEKRLAEIELQTEKLRRLGSDKVVEMKVNRPPKAFRQLTLDY